jgi:CheY-like chemotaxis protein
VLLKDATLLVVDDEPQYREILGGWLEREGSRVLPADDGLHALELLQKSDVNAIITDIRMPRMGGAELVKRVNAAGKYTPAAVSISGFSDLTSREAYDLGIEAQLSKPVERKILVSTVRRSLMEREDLWARPFHSTTRPTLKFQFESLAAALQTRRILFGRGGFCISSRIVLPESSFVDFELNFNRDGKLVVLQGIVRWDAPQEELVGIEITRVGDQARGFVADLARSNATASFIPRST